MMVYVLGHKNPDTDATVAPIIASYVFEKLFNIKATPILQGKPNKEPYFIFKHFGIEIPEIVTSYTPEDKFIIVDTTNPGELPDDIMEHEILGIVDHHKLAGLQTKVPVFTYIRPLGSSATVLLDLFEKFGHSLDEMPANILKLSLSAILSDTLNLTSPTTTEQDKNYVQKISQMFDIDHNDLANQMFEAKSDVSDLSGMDIVNYDAKKYEFGGKKVYLAVFETVKPGNVLAKYNEIKIALQEFQSSQGYDYALLFVVDILNQDAYYIRYNEQADALIKRSFDVIEETDKYYKIPGVVSRKKQIVPVLEKALEG